MFGGRDVNDRPILDQNSSRFELDFLRLGGGSRDFRREDYSPVPSSWASSITCWSLAPKAGLPGQRSMIASASSRSEITRSTVKSSDALSVP